MAKRKAKKPDDGATLSPTKMAELLTKAGGAKVTAKDVQGDIQAGAPCLSPRRIELFPYIRWLYTQAVNGAS